MASIFTFDPDPPRVSSPWARATPPPEEQSRPKLAQKTKSVGPILISKKRKDDDALSTLDYSAITRLEAEPQEGPTEYKLHLLLRKRRSFTSTSTGGHVSGSLRRNDSYAPGKQSVHSLISNTLPPLGATQSRQHRLEQLTTQMLWRLQQSCPHHGSSSTAGVQLQFPDEASLAGPATPQRLYPGLEESKGALYEIGVADDGELVGLAEDEMEESLNNLRAMAASLGCQVDVVRMLAVGDCKWVEGRTPRQSKLLVAEAYVHPDHVLVQQESEGESDQNPRATAHASLPQLRISLTGATMSGKSSLLGTLSTGTFDNGRGKSRLSLLKHRHEIESGVTSSITQELIGYGDLLDPEGIRSRSQIINYGCTDISSWSEIHAYAESLSEGKLVFLTDSAGHPRFRRTTVRGLVGWDPHYTLLCIPADSNEDAPGSGSGSRENLASAADLDLSGELLRLCLSLELSLLIVITKYDLAKKAGLKSVLARVLSTLKDAGRTGRIIADPSTPPLNASLETISAAEVSEAEAIAQPFETMPLATVPIVLTSALSGTGLRKLHALLRTLPVPTTTTPPSIPRKRLFHIEDVYTNPSGRNDADKPTIVGGHLSLGELNVGDQLLLGPYPIDSSADDSDSGSGVPSTRDSPVPTSRSYPGALQKRSTAHIHARTGSSALFEWRSVRVTSLRNLRLPVSTLYSGQVGTVGLVPIHTPISSPAMARVRKGMVLSEQSPKAHKTITVQFSGPQAESAKALTVGSAVVVFFASVRAPSKVLSVTPIASTTETTAPHGDSAGLEDEGWFGFDEDSASDLGNGASGGGATPTAVTACVQFQFIGGREFVEDGVKVLVMPGGGPGLSGSIERGEKGIAGLEGFVGRVVDESM
ncbi:uncharacterized protein CC84DRAFT_1098033 [Paraphaeosphaeria sporulosa]|uniref:Tr-type G domain-containing protein n=1 Tax=Paraphaeosphaeria sporulosa TaxID=1460663 RepID=A0A177C7E3_9PLEO|nr:uncharacterized protein CC84DRAFT_1098033 [Paraphaeosphaeria sporulosa]OAG02667.1 hypothetical protein CC84DRAFT_1098033 [Paraphaeosphaeria sporulosa]